MANILPKESITSVRRLYASRAITVISLGLVLSAALSYLLLLPVYAIVRADLQIDEEERLSSLPDDTEREKIIRSQTLVRELKTVATTSVPIHELLKDLLDRKPDRVRVESINITRGESGTILMSGPMPSREEINTYRSDLAANPQFQKVTVPFGILAGSEDTSFAITITGSF